MRSIGAVITSVVVYVFQWVLVFASSALVLAVAGIAGLPRSFAAIHVYVAFLVASSAAGYSAISVTRSAFSSVAPVVVFVGFTTLSLVYAAVVITLLVLGVHGLFGSVLDGAMFFVAVAVSIICARLAYLHSERQMHIGTYARSELTSESNRAT